MTYHEALKLAAAPDAPASAITDLLTFAFAEGIPHAAAIADRRALVEALDRPDDAVLAAATQADSASAEAAQTARSARDTAQTILDQAESQYIETHRHASDLQRRVAAADRALNRPNVKTAIGAKS